MSWRRKGLLRHSQSADPTGDAPSTRPPPGVHVNLDVRYEENAEEMDWNTTTAPGGRPPAPPTYRPLYWGTGEEETVIKREEGLPPVGAAYNPRKRLMKMDDPAFLPPPFAAPSAEEDEARAAAAAVLASRLQSEVLVYPPTVSVTPGMTSGLFRYVASGASEAVRMAAMGGGGGVPAEKRGEFMVPRDRPAPAVDPVPVRSASWSVRQDLSEYMAAASAAARDRSKTHPQIVKRPRVAGATGVQESVIQSTGGRPGAGGLLPDYVLATPGSPSSSLSTSSVGRRGGATVYRNTGMDSGGCGAEQEEMESEPEYSTLVHPSVELLSRMSSTTSTSSFSSPRPLHYAQSTSTSLPRYTRQPQPHLELDEAGGERDCLSPVLSDYGGASASAHPRMESIKVEAGTRRPSSCPNNPASPHSPLLRTASVYDTLSPGGGGGERPRSRLLESTSSPHRRPPDHPYWTASATGGGRPTTSGGEEVWETSVTTSSPRPPSGGGATPRNSSEKEAYIAIDHQAEEDGSMPLHIDVQAQDGSGICLKIIRQPESHYRPRYQKEGSRGCVKDSTGRFPLSVQLVNWEGEQRGGKAVLQVFIGSETDPVRVHPWYRVCIVGGRTSSQARIVNLDAHTTALEMDVPPGCKGLVNINCLGIVKLRNSDLEHSGSSQKKDALNRRKWTADVRLVFRAIMTDSDQVTHTAQAVSSVISCTPSSGVPQIQYTSLTQSPACGGVEIVVIGRNLVKGSTRLFVQEVADVAGREKLVWQEAVQLMPNFFTQVHLVAKIPPYRLAVIHEPVPVSLVLKNNKKCSQAFPFLYVPVHSPTLPPAPLPSKPPPAAAAAAVAAPLKPARHVSIQCVLPLEAPPPPLPLLWPPLSVPVSLALPLTTPPLRPDAKDDAALVTLAPLFPLSAHDLAFLAACGLEVDGRVVQPETAGVTEQWTVGGGAPVAPRRRLKVRPGASLAFQWSKARRPP
ncbi:nuclear factor of activated T-cells, cytoplasmic 2-like isoform X1 [Paramacrobiotus metropolitanus]|uniref:nuclear factor of activated T-cells, cytoplasmic 2-like isoform X1 n=1 Tax=Paramacrobiotus metropolitanus TaxID=2943436 RepID=UPI0024458484|nr:nuclear factor of activated T-cells, cytoplasmic 2-like isoform X1 [Paramacrobiotus metropolitanus]